MNQWDFVRLIYILRQVVPISTDDIIDALKCLRKFPDLETKLVLKKILIHRPQDLGLFESAWQMIFPQKDVADKYPPQSNEKESNSLGSGGLGLGRGSGGKSLNPQNESALSELIDVSLSSALSKDAETNEFIFEQALKLVLGKLDVYAWINSGNLAYQRGEINDEAWQNLQQEAKELENAVRRKLLSRQVIQENSWQPLYRQYWKHKPLQNITLEEKSLVQATIRQLGKQLAVHPSGYWHDSKHGTLNLPKTVRNSFQVDGHVVNLYYRQRVPRIPELIILCDVSNSVAPYAEFLLFLVSRFRARFRRIKLFFFIDTLWDVTDHVWDVDFSDLQEKISSWGHKVSSGFSDYGQVFHEFAEGILSDVSAHATIIILGDGKNNYRPPRAEYLAQIHEHVRHIIWLNPLNMEEWSGRDNAISFYKEYCSRIYRCRTVDDLKNIARHIL